MYVVFDMKPAVFLTTFSFPMLCTISYVRDSRAKTRSCAGRIALSESYSCLLSIMASIICIGERHKTICADLVDVLLYVCIQYICCFVVDCMIPL